MKYWRQNLFERSDDDEEANFIKPTDNWDKKLSKFQKIILVKCVAQEKVGGVFLFHILTRIFINYSNSFRS